MHFRRRGQSEQMFSAKQTPRPNQPRSYIYIYLYQKSGIKDGGRILIESGRLSKQQFDGLIQCLIQ